MKGICTIEELGFGRNKDEHIQAVYRCLVDEDIVICGSKELSSDMILDDCTREFKRGLLNQILDSQNPVSEKERGAVVGRLLAAATNEVNGIEQPF